MYDRSNFLLQGLHVAVRRIEIDDQRLAEIAARRTFLHAKSILQGRRTDV
jgi:hypothetical protein